MSYNDLLLCNVFGADTFIQYKHNLNAIRAEQKERERQERKAFWKGTLSILGQSIKPTVDFYDDWCNADPKHPNIDRFFSTSKYAIEIGEIAYDECVKQSENTNKACAY